MRTDSSAFADATLDFIFRDFPLLEAEQL